MTVALRGMAWDHPRARNPLEAIAEDWMRTHDARIEWEARPLKAFEDQPLEELASTYDLVLIDHPFVATAAKSGLIAPVDDWADADYLEDQAAGPSYHSYSWDGRQWALAIDATCQVSAVRDDLWSASHPGSLPDTWAEVLELAQALRVAQ
jgi:multiple sugar transport system substrate-binding protein